MSFLSAIGGFFKKIFGFVVKSDPFKQLVNQLLPVAIEIATNLASIDTLSSAEKRNTLFNALADAAKARGLQFADHMLFLLAEVAVAKVKGTLAIE
jgi:hypothetical protein